MYVLVSNCDGHVKYQRVSNSDGDRCRDDFTVNSVCHRNHHSERRQKQTIAVANRCVRLPGNENISVKLQLNLHQNEPLRVKKSQNFLGGGHRPHPSGATHLTPSAPTAPRSNPPLGNVWLRAWHKKHY